MKKMIIRFCFLGIPMGIFMGLILSTATDAPNMFWSIVLGFAFAACTLSIPILFHYFVTKNIKTKYGNWGNTFEVKHTKTIILNLPINEAYKEVALRLKEIKGLSVKDWDYRDKLIASKSSLFFFLEDKIMLEFESDNKEIANIKITSEPRNRLLVIDNGRNLKNVLAISQMIEEFISMGK